MSHQTPANKNQVKTKLQENSNSVHRHLESTSVVNISCKNFNRFSDQFTGTILHTPPLRIARLRVFRKLAPGMDTTLLEVCRNKNNLINASMAKSFRNLEIWNGFIWILLKIELSDKLLN